jgi:membrane protease YdiL (CAAX protease family)
VTGPGADEQPANDTPAPRSAPPSEPGPEIPLPGSGSEPEGPPGTRIFSLEGRRAPGLYLVGWILTVVGLAVAFVLGPLASDRGNAAWLILFGSAVTAVGFAAAAGAQVLERAGREGDAYRGPAPLLVFGAYYFLMSVVGILLIVIIGIDEESPFVFFATTVVQTSAYLLSVWLMAVRTDALSWQDMGWPGRQAFDLRAVLRTAGASVAVMVPVTFVVLIVGTIVGLLFGVEAPRPYPLSETPLQALLVFAGAAIVAPIGEEVFFRGFALTAWRRDLGDRTALLRTTAFFALLHLLPITGDTLGAIGQAVLVLAVLVPVGYVFGWLFLRYGLVGAIAGHITYNSLLLLLAFLASKVPEPALLQWWP